jgi:two-component system sensor histidine kinase/response regulator
MDMQMPVMDGITATRRIRETMGAQVLPIVAMTANAMQKDRERCLDAGMNGFITKPINPNELWRSLLEWTCIRPDMGPHGAVLTRSSATQEAGVEALLQRLRHIPELDVDLGLSRTNNNPGFYVSMLRKFIPAQRDAAKRIHMALADGNVPSAERLAHTLKGVAAHLGAEELQQCAGMLEENVRKHAGAPATQASLLHMDDALDRLLQNLHASHLVEPAADLSTAPLDAQEQKQALAVVEQIKGLLEQNDANALVVWEQHVSLLRRLLPDADRIADAISEFEMERAIELLQAAEWVRLP